MSRRRPVRSAFTLYSAMLRSGRAATLGRDGMPAEGRAGVVGTGAAPEGRSGAGREAPERGGVREGRTARASTAAGAGGAGQAGPRPGAAMRYAHAVRPHTTSPHLRWPAAAPPLGPRPRPAGSWSARDRHPEARQAGRQAGRVSRRPPSQPRSQAAAGRRCTRRGGAGSGAATATPPPSSCRRAPLTMRQLTSIRRGPRLVYLPSTWNTPCRAQGRTQQEVRETQRRAVAAKSDRAQEAASWLPGTCACNQHRSSLPALATSGSATHYLQPQRLAALDRQLQQLPLLVGGQDGGGVGAGLVEVRLQGGPVVGDCAIHGLALRRREGGGGGQASEGGGWGGGGGSGGRRIAGVWDAGNQGASQARRQVGTPAGTPLPSLACHQRSSHDPCPAPTCENTRSTSTSGPSRYSSIRQLADRPLDCGRGWDRGAREWR